MKDIIFSVIHNWNNYVMKKNRDAPTTSDIMIHALKRLPSLPPSLDRSTNIFPRSG